MYLTMLTSESSTYNRGHCDSVKFYYNALQINVKTSGFYTLTSKSTTGLNSNLYEQYFHPFNPSHNLLSVNTDICANNQFSLSSTFLVNHTYVLLLTSYYVDQEEKIYIISTGPDAIIYNSISKFRYVRKITYKTHNGK